MPHFSYLMSYPGTPPLLDCGLGTWTSEFPLPGPAWTHALGPSFCGGLANGVATDGHKSGKEVK